ncbi:MAG TPA: hypothetical protein VLL08_19810 [Kineosporiaceae bacterium]|nr:hypothetical protein [Kineosporiaceae bacterium]
MLGWAPITVAVVPAFGSEDPLKPVERCQWYHQTITQAAAAAEGWGAGAADELGRHTLGVDLYAYHPIWCAQGGPRRWRGVRMARPALANLHFDNLADGTEVAEIWHRVTGGLVVGIEWAAQHGDARAARQAIGVGLHAIQDFYSHSTWINDPARRERTWLEQGGAGAGPDLSTGGFGPGTEQLAHRHGDTRPTWRTGFRLLAMLLGPITDLIPAGLRNSRGPRPDGRPPAGIRYSAVPGINLDSRWQARIGVRTRGLSDLDADSAFELALGLASRESRTLLVSLNRRFAEDRATAAFWAQVIGGPQSDWTGAFDDPAILAYDFLAAGHYPPVGSAASDAARWFHRVLLTTPTSWTRPDRRSARLRTLDAADRELSTTVIPIGRALTVGPVPADAATLELTLPSRCRVQIHAFKRAPEPVLRPLLDRSPIAATTIRVPIAIPTPLV